MKKTILYYLFLAAAFAAIYFMSIPVNDPGSNIGVMLLGGFVFFSGKVMGKAQCIFTRSLNILFVIAMFFPLGCISLSVLIITLLFFAMIIIFQNPFRYYMEKVRVREEVLSQSREELEKVKSEGVSKAKSDDDNIEGEIKLITALYSSVKELSQSMTMTETVSIIMAIMKKLFRYNYSANIENMNMALILQQGKSYSIMENQGYDEEFIKDNEKEFVKNILTSVRRTKNIVYKNREEKDKNSAMLGSVLYIPFFIEDRLLGVFFMSSSDRDIFSGTQITNLQVLASQIAISLEKVFLYEEVQKMSVTDSLTGLYVHRYFQEKLENEMKRASRYEHNLSVIMGDIDFFKKINDTYGHLAGDYILKNIALILKNSTTPADTVARYGGEEFIIIMPDTDKDTAFGIAEGIRAEIEKTDFNFKGRKIDVTMSIGVATFPGDAITRRSIVDKTDKALYRAKEEGRNRVIKS